MPPRAVDAARPDSNEPKITAAQKFGSTQAQGTQPLHHATGSAACGEHSRHRTAGARVKMGHGESNVPWGTRTAIAGARKLPKIRASNEIAIGLGLGFVGALPR